MINRAQHDRPHRWQRIVASGALLFVSLLVLTGCGFEAVGRVLVRASELGEMPAQINNFSADPQEIVFFVPCPGGGGSLAPGMTRVRWEVVGKRIGLRLDGVTVHEQSTPEIRATISGETDVQLDPSSIGVLRLVAYNAVDARVIREIPLTISVQLQTGCTPPCTPDVDC